MDIVVPTALVNLQELKDKDISFDAMFRYLDLEVSKLQDNGYEIAAAYLAKKGLDILAGASHV